MGVVTWLANFLRDLRWGVRQLAAGGTFAAIGIGSLALGMGGSTAMYSVVHAVILDPFPYQDVDRLMERGHPRPRRAHRQLEPLLHRPISRYCRRPIGVPLRDCLHLVGRHLDRRRGTAAFARPLPHDTFDAMGMPPLIGRAHDPVDAAEDATPVTLLGYRFWQREFGGSGSNRARSLLNGKMRTVIGGCRRDLCGVERMLTCRKCCTAARMSKASTTSTSWRASRRASPGRKPRPVPPDRRGHGAARPNEFPPIGA